MTPSARARRRRRPAGSDRVVLVLAGVVFLAHLAVSAFGPYELHRDALLYLAMGEHLHLLRMDFPPFIALLAQAERLFVDSEVLIHVGPALAHAALILLAAAFAARMGGGRTARALAALVVATAPVFMRAGALFQPVVFDQLWWTASLYVLLRLGQESLRRPATPDRPRRGVPPLARTGGGRWALLGLLLGLGLLTKFTILVLGLSMLVAILVTPLRPALRTSGPWAAAALAFLVGSPSVIGQLALDWPVLQQLRDLQTVQLDRVSPAAFALEQLLLVGPIVLVAAAGAIWTIVGRVDPGARAVGWATVVAFALFLLVGGKAYYVAPIWPALLGIGFAGLQRWTRRLPARLAEARPRAAAAGRWIPAAVWGAVVLVVVGFGGFALPMGLPMLPPATMARYAAWTGVTPAVTTNTGEQLALPQDYADMLGWRTLADSVGAVYRSLPETDRADAVIVATNYGRAGAIDYYAGPDIPHAVAPVGSYWFWGPGPRSGQVSIIVGAEVEDLVDEFFRTATVAARVRNPWGVPEERDVAIVVARDPIRPLQDVWPRWRGVN